MGGSKDVLTLQYRAIGWPSKPGDPEAVARFASIEEFMRSLLKKGVFREVLSIGRARVLDVMAASGICGVALARVLSEVGVYVDLVVSDLREEELGLAREWVREASIKEGAVRLSTAVADAAMLPKHFKGAEFDVATVWGSSLPHLDAWQLPLLISGVRELQPPHGVLIIEQADLLPGILVRNDFRYVLVEGREALTIFETYDTLRGVQRRLLYKLPEMKYLGRVESRLWEVAQVLVLTWLFYEDVDLHEHREMGRNTKAIVAKHPRKSATKWSELVKSARTPLLALIP